MKAQFKGSPPNKFEQGDLVNILTDSFGRAWKVMEVMDERIYEVAEPSAPFGGPYAFRHEHECNLRLVQSCSWDEERI